MSNKMLDSILEGAYGEKNNIRDVSTPNIVSDILEQIPALIESKLSHIQSVKPDDIRELKDEIRSMANAKKDELKHIVSDGLFRKISMYEQYPAFIILINAILTHHITSPSQMKKVKKEEVMPGNWVNGVKKLLKNDILLGTSENFYVNPEFEEELRVFLVTNSEIARQVEMIYSATDLDGKELHDKAREIAANLVF
jgi:hypothetical protein